MAEPDTTPHFAFPFRREGGKVAVVDQDTDEHVMACENVIVRCPAGHREERPEFGWEFPVFRSVPLDLEPLRVALTRFEPRGNANVEQYADAASAAVRHVNVYVES